MTVSAEISLYPLTDAFRDSINVFLAQLTEREGISVHVGSMSTVIVGQYDTVMQVLTDECRAVFEQGAAAFVVKLSNGCPV